MKLYAKIIIGLLLLAANLSTLSAQEYHYEIGLHGGIDSYLGEANRSAIFYSPEPTLGVVFRHNINFRWALKANLNWGSVSGDTRTFEYTFPFHNEYKFRHGLVDFGVQGEFNFLPYSDKFLFKNTSRLSPYILLGLGATVAPIDGKTLCTLNLPIGIGLKYKVINRVNLGLEVTMRKQFSDGIDLPELSDPMGLNDSLIKNKDWVSMLLFSVTWDFGPNDRKCNNKFLE